MLDIIHQEDGRICGTKEWWLIWGSGSNGELIQSFDMYCRHLPYVQGYAFDVIGELYFGRMFGFMAYSHDHENYIHSLDTLMPLVCFVCHRAGI